MNRERPEAEREARPNLLAVWNLPFLDERWPGKVLPGGVLLLLSPLLLPLIPAWGYLVARVRATGGASASLPSWRPLGERWRDGLRLFALLLAYGWPGLLTLSTVIVGPLVINGPLTGTAAASWLVWLALAVQPIGLIWMLLLYFLFPVLLRRAAASERWREALSPTRLWELIRANYRSLPETWLYQTGLMLLSLAGLIVAFVGVAFTSFWALTSVAWLAGQLNDPATQSDTE